MDRLTTTYDPEYGFGSFSNAIYDSAWVSMVSKESLNQQRWLFPECFKYILENQRDDGGWDSYGSEIDGILNTAASLLSLSLHMSKPHQITDVSTEDLRNRSTRAVNALKALLQAWDVDATEHVGFEILVPAMMRLLKHEGMHFAFSGESLLKSINERKMSKVDPNQLYKAENKSIFHSLEAFADQIDCSRFTHQKTAGSIMASPAATAAYLIYSSSWDDKAEAYLQHVVARSSNTKDYGGVPSAFPSTHFEFSWVLSTLLDANFDLETLGVDQIERIRTILTHALKTEDGLIGFAPYVVSDADDTSKAILALTLLGQTTSIEKLIDAFEGENHFRTYLTERNASFSTNCNVLSALLHMGSVASYLPQIEKVTRFLCSSWWISSNRIKDKWHLSSSYPTMLFVQALIRLLKLWNDGLQCVLPDDLIRTRIPIILCQALIRTLQAQNSDGSWGDRNSDESTHEETAYSVLTLARISSIAFPEPLQLCIMAAIENGRKVLLTHAEKPRYLWIEKVSYKSDALCESYCLAALNIHVPVLRLGSKVECLFALPMERVNKFTHFYSQLPLLAGVAKWRIQASLIEGYLFQPLIKRVRLDIFPRKNMEEDKYFEYIPSTWTCCNNLDETYISDALLYDMMVVSFLNYQADEYMETVGNRYARDRIDALKNVVENIFRESEVCHMAESGSEVGDVNIDGNDLTNSDRQIEKTCGTLRPDSETGDIIDEGQDHTMAIASDVEELNDIRSILKCFVDYVLRHPTIMQANKFNQASLRTELRVFLLAHITQAEDNARLAAQQTPGSSITVPFKTPRGSYFDWVHTTSAAHTSCPYSFAFLTCLLSGTGTTCFETVKEKYLAQDVCRHLSTMCRMYNDFGSLARDRAEANLNSVNFREFGADGLTTSDQELKDRLWRLAEYERECLDLAFTRLEQLSLGCKRKRSVLRIFKMFTNVTDFYGQIYVVRDIATRMSGA
ncbi:hypothetical protein IMSHALPRED_003626 [Imshaugia aleurites]|uniref:Ent-kaurene synthase n=1 Tax=Imshaugia aleurites TaxID=172621 RepID=A0A8H3J7Q7_9LECA|nr:hypothetical protein IMSHALPRED_003626 [Imshaugia aleurites]